MSNTASRKMIPTPRPCSGLRSSGANRTEIMRALEFWPTPRATEAGPDYAKIDRSSTGISLHAAVGGSLNPTWVEWLMGFPPNWTEVNVEKKNTLRKRARKATAQVEACQACGATKDLQRHHTDYSNPDLVEVLCPPCHIKADQRDGTRRKRRPKTCGQCGKEFMPTHSKKHNLCSPECRSIAGRMNAEKRWGKSGQSSRTSEG